MAEADNAAGLDAVPARTLAEREAAVLVLERGAAQHALIEAQLREANEQLVLATVRAQALTDAAVEATAQMAFMASHDLLTGLPNRALLADRFAQAMALAQRHDKRVALLFLDLDHFKQVNDSLGHAAGDRLLQMAAQRLLECVRTSDTVCRQGGDEFVLLLSEVEGLGDATMMADKLIAVMVRPYGLGDEQLRLSVSIGISLFPDDGPDFESLVHNADSAMYDAKRAGRNGYQVYAPDRQSDGSSQLWD